MQFGLSIAFSDPANYCRLAQAAEENGFAAITLPDHLIYPERFSAPYPYTEDGVPRFSETDPFPDPWIATATMAAVTSRIEFYTSVFVLPARNPVQVAKTLATAAVFSGNRVSLGIGMGWMPEEFAISGQSFAARGRRADEMITVMRKLWSGEMVAHQGEFYNFEPVRMLPVPDRDIPIYVGGFSKPAMRRAANNDGWIADLHTLSELEQLCGEVDRFRTTAGTADRPFRKLAFGCVDAFDAAGYRAMADMGIDVTSTMPWIFHGHGFTPTIEQAEDSLKRFADEVISQVPERAG